MSSHSTSLNLKNLTKPFSVQTYRNRRLKLADMLSREEAEFTAVFFSGSELHRNADSTFPFRAHSDFLYLTGFAEPEGLILIQRKSGRTKTAIGLRPRDLSNERGSEIWDGERVGVERAPGALKFDFAFDIHESEKILASWFRETNIVYWGMSEFEKWDQKILQVSNQLNFRNSGRQAVKKFADPRPALHEMRKQKSKEEIDAMRRSAVIASLGHIHVMKSAKAGHYEFQVAAEAERKFKYLGAQANAYNSIVATGANACTLHYISNSKSLAKEDLLLIDAGAELDGYASDITRCFPVSGKFSKAQREVYSWVLKSQIAACKAVKPGVPFIGPHEVALEILCEGLVTMGFFKGKSTKEVIKKGLYKNYFPHMTSHWLGLDVHDCGCVREEGSDQFVKLQPGNVLTIEPGLYFRIDDKTVPKEYKGIGVRIEDDVVVTSKGNEVLTASCPKEIKDIEAVMKLKP